MDSNKTVRVVDNKGGEYRGKIFLTDHYSLSIDVGNGEHKSVWLPHIVTFELVD